MIRPRLAGLLFATSAVAALRIGSGLICPGNACTTPLADLAVLSAMNIWRHPLLDNTFSALTTLGSLSVLLPVSVLLAMQHGRRLPMRQAMFIPLAVSGAALLAHVTKIMVARPRPELFPALTEMPLDSSFPSAHTLQVVAFATAWMLRPGRVDKVDTKEIGAVMLLVLSVAVSRMYLQVHFPSDVAFGALAGALWVIALQRWMKGMEAAR